MSDSRATFSGLCMRASLWRVATFKSSLDAARHALAWKLEIHDFTYFLVFFVELDATLYEKNFEFNMPYLVTLSSS